MSSPEVAELGELTLELAEFSSGNLASFKLSYVSPENHKIGKSGWWKLGRKSGVWRRKTGFENFSLNENGCF